MIRGFQKVSDSFRQHPDKEITLPTRGTKYSAGYDFYSPIAFEVEPHGTYKLAFDVKACMQEGEVLQLYIRSSIGIKKGLTLANSVAIIDKDYHNNPSNDGGILAVFHNNTNQFVVIEEGERLIQGLFTSFLVAYNGNTENLRVGGVGSTT